MAVLVEGISVLVREDAIRNKMPGGWERFLLLVPNGTLCRDGELVRVGFMEPPPMIAFINELEELGLVYLTDDKATDLIVCDQLKGPAAKCDWLQFGRFGFEHGKVGMAWLWEGSRGFGIHMPASGLKLATPRGWQFKDSLSDKFTHVPQSLTASRTDH